MISIVVTSYTLDRLDDITELIRSIDNQTSKRFELVYVTEDEQLLKQRVESLVSNTSIKSKIIHNTGTRGLAEARNIGAKAASGDIIGFVDDDVVLDRDWVKTIDTAFSSSNKIIAATGPALPMWIESPANWLPIEFDWLIGCTRWFNAKEPKYVRNCWGMNMCFRRSAFEQAGFFSTDTGFHRGAMAEDLEFSLRVRAKTGMEIIYLPEMLVWNRVHSYRLSNRFIIERSSWIGHSRRSMKKAQINMDFKDGYERHILQSFLRKSDSIVFPRGLGLLQYSRRLKVIALSLMSLGLGYLLGSL